MWIRLRNGEILNLDHVAFIKKLTATEWFSIEYNGSFSDEGYYIETFNTEEARQDRFDELVQLLAPELE